MYLLSETLEKLNSLKVMVFFSGCACSVLYRAGISGYSDLTGKESH